MNNMDEEADLLTLEQLCSICALEHDWLVVRVREGLIPATGSVDAGLRFTTTTLTRVHRMRDIERNFDAAPELAALAADLLERIDELRARLRRAGLD